MAEEKLLTVREVSLLLGISEKDVLDFAQSGKIPAYKVGGTYLRFKREQIEEFKKTLKIPAGNSHHSSHYSLRERLNDLFYYNDFYILSGLIILIILLIIFQGYQE